MKRIVLLILLALLPLASNSWADSTASATGSSEVQIIQDLSDRSQSVSQDKRQHVLAVPGTAGMFPFPSGSGSIGQWILLTGQPLLKKFDPKILDEAYVKNMKIWDHQIRKKYLQETVYDKDAVPENKDPIVRLDWAPQGDVFYTGDKLLMEIEIIGSHEWTSTASLLLGLRRAKELTNTRRVVIWIRYKTEAFNKGRSLGSGAGGGLMVGPHGSPDNKAIAIALGGLWGTSWGGLWHSVDVRIWCLNDGPVDPPPALLARLKKEEASPKAEVAPKAEAAPSTPPCAECEAKLAKEKAEREKAERDADEFAKRAQEEAERAKKAEAEAARKVEKIELCSASLLFPINEYLPTMDSQNIEEARKMIRWLLKEGKEIKKQGGKIVMVGGCDERLANVYKKTDKKYVAMLKSLVSPNEAWAAEYHKHPTDSDIINWPLGGKRSRMSKVMLARAADGMGVLNQVSDIIKGIENVSSGKDWYVNPENPLDGRNRYAMLGVMFGGPGAAK